MKGLFLLWLLNWNNESRAEDERERWPRPLEVGPPRIEETPRGIGNSDWGVEGLEASKLSLFVISINSIFQEA